MLLAFNLENYKSYYKENSLNLISSSKVRNNKEQIVENKRFKVLKYAALLGTNGCGKSNMINALVFVKNFIIRGTISDLNFSFKGKQNEPTKFTLVLEIDNFIYSYEFEIKKSDGLLVNFLVVSEKLTRSTLYGNEETIYELTENKINFTNKIKINENLKVYLENYNNSIKNIAFLTYLNDISRKNNLADGGESIIKVFDYIFNKLIVISTTQDTTTPNVDLKEISSKLKKYDTGIELCSFVDINHDEVVKYFPNDSLRNILNSLIMNKATNAILNDTKDLFFIDLKDLRNPKIKKLIFKHKNINSDFSFNEESEGTLRILTLFSFLANKDKDITFIVDEIDRSLHPLVTLELLKDFINENQYTESDQNKTQLIFSSHLTMLLNKKILRSDEIYFVNKDNFGESAIYSLADYKSRSDICLEKNYYDGAYAAIPKFIK